MPTSSDNDAAAPRGASRLPFRLIGLLLLAAAVLLHVRQTGAERSRDIGARKVRESAAAGVIGMGLRATPAEGGQEPIFEPCSREASSNLLSRLAAAEPTREKPPAKARSYDLFLLLSNRARAYLRVFRAPGSDEAFVALRSVQGTGSPPVELDCLPARVEGLGRFFDELDAGGAGESLRKAPQIPTLEGWRFASRGAAEAGLPAEALSSTAASLRAIADKPVIALGASSGRRGHDGRLPVSMIMDPALGSALRAFAGAEDVETPHGSFDGTPCSVAVFLEGRVRLALMVAIPDDAPQDALVGFVEQESVSADGGTVGGTSVSAPARVPGLGAILAPALDAAEKLAAGGEG